ncbi:MAG TPA: BrnT family toxin [Spirochaetota bacterium]|mgnify:CR=1 FL=1|nr:BrnT family toxin [Spirochaetota bacterium]HPI88406.1 BrnT family toxin [Spirochaetota bacterium]
MALQYNFEWDIKKAKGNFRKHGVNFENASTVIRDPHAITIYDDEHGDSEDRWITLGVADNGLLLVVHHTFKQVDKNTVSVRIISSRKATKKETRQYMEI